MTKDNATTNNPPRTALVVGSILLALAGLSIYRHRHTAAWLLGTGGVLSLCGQILPTWAWRFHAVWITVARFLGYVNGRILLGALFFSIVTVSGLVRRLLGHDPLQRRCGRRDSYWVPRAVTRPTKEQFDHLF